MRQSSAPRAAPPRWEAASTSVFSALLLLYPSRFRRIYGAQMAQTFRASLRQAAREGGALAVARLWRLTLGDTLISALAERMEKDMTVQRSALYSATGVVAMIAIPVWILGVIALVVAEMVMGTMGQAPSLAVGMGVPFAWMFFVVGFFGLYARLAEGRRGIVWLPGAIVIALLLALIAGSAYYFWAAQVGVTPVGNASIVNLGARGSVNETLGGYAYDIKNLAYPWIGVALLATALLIRSAPGLRRPTRLLAILGAASVLMYFFTDMGAPPILRNTGTPGLMGMMAGTLVYYFIWLGCWGALGLWLFRQGATQVSPAPAITPTPPGEGEAPA
ncbi:MAG: hypothetical protein KGO05_14045 [Chloroflexota bacterium]|nr:hypothetical protein [Chloroflexota bacterium]